MSVQTDFLQIPLRLRQKKNDKSHSIQIFFQSIFLGPTM